MIEVLVGPIASGKSTYAKARAGQGAVIINDDAIVNAVHGGDYTQYSKELKHLYKQAEMSIMTNALEAGRDVIIDRPNTARTTRRRYIGIAHAYDVQVTAVIFPDQGPEVHARRRFEKDSRNLPYEHWIEAATRHARDAEPPAYDEGFDNIVPADVARDMAESYDETPA